MTVYHVTLAENKPSIQASGLIPQLGPRAKMAGETEIAIYLFPDYTDMEVAMDNWLGELFEDEDIVACQIALPKDFPIFESTVDWEVLATQVIPPQYIRFIGI